ncbi:UNVERIFIED_CONTAM: hypothetical protein FKN15_041804 [Acipenser sinensis]
MWLTPLHRAVASRSEDAVRVLIRHSADVNARDKSWQAPLHVAAANKALRCAEVIIIPLLSSVNVSDRGGRTALHHAVLNGHVEMVNLLLEKGANINAFDKKDRRALHWAAYMGKSGCGAVELQGCTAVPRACLYSRNSFHLRLLMSNESVLSAGFEIDTPDSFGRTCLHAAAAGGNVDCVKLLLSSGADFNKKDKCGRRGIHGMFPLHLAALKAHSDCCRKLLSSGFEIDTPDSFGRTCLHAAAAGGNVDCVKLLLSSGADFNKKDKCGRTPLHYSAASRHFQCIETLVSTGTSVNAADDWGRCALHYAAASDLDRKRRSILGETHGAVEENEGSQEEREKEASLCLEFLLQNEANPSIRDKQGYSAVHYAAAYGHRHCLELLLDRAHSSPEDSESQGGARSPLHLAAYHGHAQALDVLLQSVSDLDAVDEGGRTPLSLAALRGHAECVEALLSQGASVNVTEKSQGRTPVHLAAMNGHTLCLQLLIEGAESADIVDVADSRGQTPLMLAVANGHMDAILTGHEDCVQLLMEQEASYLLGDCRGRTALHFAAARGLATWLCDFLPNTFSEGNPALRDSQGYTLLHWACYNGHENCVEVLLEQKVCRSFEGNSFSPLHCAVIKNHESCASILLDTLGSGIVECRDIKGRTPLHAAAFSDSVDCVQLLLSHGAPVNTVDQSGRSAVMMAAEHGRAGAVEVLVTSANANLSLRDENKNTAFHLACSNGHEKCALLILGKIEDQNLINATNAALQTVLLYGSGECQEVDSYWSTTKVMPDNQGLIVTVVIVKVFKIKDIFFTGSSLGFHEAREQGKVPSPHEGWISGGKALCPLHLAARNGLKQVVQLLLSRGASVQALDENAGDPSSTAV